MDHRYINGLLLPGPTISLPTAHLFGGFWTAALGALCLAQARTQLGQMVRVMLMFMLILMVVVSGY